MRARVQNCFCLYVVEQVMCPTSMLTTVPPGTHTEISGVVTSGKRGLEGSNLCFEGVLRKLKPQQNARLPELLQQMPPVFQQATEAFRERLAMQQIGSADPSPGKRAAQQKREAARREAVAASEHATAAREEDEGAAAGEQQYSAERSLEDDEQIRLAILVRTSARRHQCPRVRLCATCLFLLQDLFSKIC